jgi:hypothetical protein
MIDPVFDAGLIESDPAIIFVLDRRLRIAWCNRAWNDFARANGGGSLHSDAVRGRPITDFISGSLADYYRTVYSRVLERSATWLHDYECSSAATSRHFTMHVYPLEAATGLMVINSLRVESPTPDTTQPNESDYVSPHGFIVMCSNCRRTQRHRQPDRWDWVPHFVEHPPELVSHGLCPICLDHYHLSFQRVVA